MFSECGRIVPELNDPGIREIFVYRYRLLYEVGDNRVLVVAFLHGARDFATWQQNQKQLYHFHAYYQDATAVFAIDPVECIGGSLPRTQRRLVEAWIEPLR